VCGSYAHTPGQTHPEFWARRDEPGFVGAWSDAIKELPFRKRDWAQQFLDEVDELDLRAKRRSMLRVRAGFGELATLINRGSFHGQDLVLALRGTDRVWRAEALLTDAEQEGLITRGKLEPTKEQKVFGVGGFHGSKSTDSVYASTVCYHWITKTTKYLE
jgi:hypothetical protein